MVENACEKIKAITRDSVTKIHMLETVLPKDGVIAGIERIPLYSIDDTVAHWGYEPFYGTDNIHFSMDTAYLELGIDKMLEKLKSAQENAATEEKRLYARGVYRTYEAISDYIERHATAAQAKGLEKTAANCLKVAHSAPDTFEEALQLFWFVWTLRSAFSHIRFRNLGNYMGTIGRFDQHFYPYLKRDIENGVTTKEKAFALVKEVFVKMNGLGSGDTLKNLMLGGCDESGRDESNLLSFMCIDACMELKLPEPHLNVRVHPNMDPAFFRKAMELILMGQGQGEIFNDAVIIPQLEKHGIPSDVAHDYCCDGCEEIILDKKSSILFKELEALKVLELAYFNGEENPCQANKLVHRWTSNIGPRTVKTILKLGFRSGDMRNAASYEEVYEMFLRQYRYQVKELIDWMRGNIKFYEEDCISSMVFAGGYLQSLENGDDPYREVIKYNLFQIESGTITTVADALAGIKRVVFEEKFVSMPRLLDAISRDFSGDGDEAIRQRLLAAPKFGNDIDEVDLIAADIADNFCKWVLEENDKMKAYLWPAMYSIFFMDHAALTGATSDGRHAGYPIAEHNGPTPGKATHGPSAILRSASKIDLNGGFAGSPVFLTLSRSIVPHDREGLRIVESIVRSAIDMGLPILSFAINDIDELLDAKKHPELHEDLVVRVWGFNARFIDLMPELQDHVIKRTIGENAGN